MRKYLAGLAILACLIGAGTLDASANVPMRQFNVGAVKGQFDCDTWFVQNNVSYDLFVTIAAGPTLRPLIPLRTRLRPGEAVRALSTGYVGRVGIYLGYGTPYLVFMADDPC